MKAEGENLRGAMRAVEQVYAELEALPVERNCIARTRCCRFRLTGKTPMLTLGEALVAARAVRAIGRREVPESTDPSSGRCPFLGREDRCAIYASRPLGCRTHFCAEAGGPVARREVAGQIRRLEEIEEGLRGRVEPRSLVEAVEEAYELLAGARKRRAN
jgi:Fe-S-cluster containining protein